MKKSTLIISALVFSICIAYLLYGQQADKEKTILTTHSNELNKITLQNTQNFEIVEPVVTLPIEKSIEEVSDSIDVSSEDDYAIPFNGISRQSTKSKAILEKAGLLPKDLKGEAYVEFDLDTLRGLEKGDTFNLEIPQTSEMFSADVMRTEEFSNGDKSIFGRLVGSDGVLHTTVLTVGENAVYGQFTAVSGNYVFESLGKYGWLAAKRDLYGSHVEYEAVQMGSTTTGSDDVFAPKEENNNHNIN